MKNKRKKSVTVTQLEREGRPELTGWAVVYSACWCCHRQFGYNPKLVPSIRIDGVKEPTCRGCLETANIHRKAAGLDQLVVLPGAYEPFREEEL